MISLERCNEKMDAAKDLCGDIARLIAETTDDVAVLGMAIQMLVLSIDSWGAPGFSDILIKQLNQSKAENLYPAAGTA